MDISRMSLWRLKFRYGESNGKDRDAEQELQRRGFNSTELGAVIWEYGQQKWQKEAKKARGIHREKKERKRRLKRNAWRRRCRERRRQEEIARVAGIKQEVVIVRDTVDPSACDGSCPF